MSHSYLRKYPEKKEQSVNREQELMMHRRGSVRQCGRGDTQMRKKKNEMNIKGSIQKKKRT